MIPCDAFGISLVVGATVAYVGGRSSGPTSLKKAKIVGFYETRKGNLLAIVRPIGSASVIKLRKAGNIVRL